MTNKGKATGGAGAPILPPEIKSMMQPEEKIIRVATIHWGIYWKSAVFGVLTLILLLNPFFVHLGMFFSLVVLVMASTATLYRHYLLLVLTDRRVFLRHGILRVDTIQIRHSRIESVETERTIMGQMLGYAAVVIYGTGSRRTAIPFIADALQFRNELDAMLEHYEERSAGRGRDTEK